MPSLFDPKDWLNIPVWGMPEPGKAAAAIDTPRADSGRTATQSAPAGSPLADLPPRDRKALVDTLIGEAAGEGPEGMAAVAHVVKNRADRRGQSLGDVVRAPHQFSGYAKPGFAARRAQRDPNVRSTAESILADVLAGKIPDPTGGADFFHTPAVSPGWATAFQPTTTIGNHKFYRSPDDEPANRARTAAVPEPKPGADAEEDGEAERAPWPVVLPQTQAIAETQAAAAPDRPRTGGGALAFRNPGQDAIDDAFRSVLTETSKAVGYDFEITSGYRSPQHPVEARKKTPGQHAKGTAADINMRGLSQAQRENLIRELRAQGVMRFGLYSNSPDMLHVDMKDQTGTGQAWFMYDRTARKMDNAPKWYRDLASSDLAAPSTETAQAATSSPAANGAQFNPDDWANVSVWGQPAPKPAEITEPARMGETSVSGRPIYEDPEGGVYSEKTVTFPIEGEWYTFPSVDAEGRQMTEDQVADYVRQNGPVDPITGETFPAFDSREAAETYARERSATRMPDATAALSPAGEAAIEPTDALNQIWQSLEEQEPGRYRVIPQADLENWRAEWAKRQDSQFMKGLKGALVDQNPELLGNALDAMGVLTGSQTVRDLGETVEGYGKSGSFKRQARVGSVADIRSLGDAADFAAYSLGQALGSMAPSMAVGGATAAVTANPVVGLAAGAVGPSYVQNLGDVYGAVRDSRGIRTRIDAGELTEKQVAGWAAGAAVFMAGLDVAGVGGALGVGAKPLKQAISRRIVRGLATGALTEGSTEALQEVVSQAVQEALGDDKAMSERAISVIDNAVAGALGGGAVGGVAGAARRGGGGESAGDKGAPEPTPQQPTAARETAQPSNPLTPSTTFETKPSAPPPLSRAKGALGQALEHGDRRATEAAGGTFVVDDPAVGDMGAGPLNGARVRLAPDQSGMPPQMRRIVLPDGTEHVIGDRLLVPERTAASGGATTGIPKVGETVTVNMPEGGSFRAKVEGMEGGDALISDPESGELLQVPLDAITRGRISDRARAATDVQTAAAAPSTAEPAPVPGSTAQPESPSAIAAEPPAAATEPAASTDPALEPAAPIAPETRSEPLPPRSESLPAMQRLAGPPQPGQRVIVDAEGVDRFPAQVRSYEEGATEALVVRDDGTELQVPVADLRTSRLTEKEVEKQDLQRNPPVERETITRTEPTPREVLNKQIVMPDERHARLFDLGRLRRDSQRLGGTGALDLDNVNPGEQARLAEMFKVSPRSLGQIADDYRYRVERAARGATTRTPVKVAPVNPKLLERMTAEDRRVEKRSAAVETDEAPNLAPEGTAATQEPTDAATWWRDLTPDGRQDALKRAGVKRSVKTRWENFPANIQAKITAARPVQPMPPIDQAANDAATSPTNDRPEPTQAQKEAGNYKLGHVRLGGLDLSIENPAGSQRRGTDRSGKPWAVTMKSHYGYIKGTVGKDKDHIDVFVRPGTESLADDAPVYIVDQIDPETEKFDEHKVLIGFDSEETARAAYLENYDDGWRGLGNITATTLGGFKGWLREGDTRRPMARTAEPQIVDVDALGDYARGVVGDDIQSVMLVGSIAEKGRGNDIDLLYDIGPRDLPKDPDEAAEAVTEIIERTNVDLDRYDSFFKAGDRYFYVSTGAGREVIENTEYAREQAGRPARKLAPHANTDVKRQVARAALEAAEKKTSDAVPTFLQFRDALPADIDGDPDFNGVGRKILERVSEPGAMWAQLSDSQKRRALAAAKAEPRRPTAERPVDITKLSDAVTTFATASAAADWLAARAGSPPHRRIAKRIRDHVGEAEIRVVDDGDVVPGPVAQMMSTIAKAVYYHNFGNGQKTVYVRPNVDEATLLHELIHVATNERIFIGNARENADTELGRAVADLFALQRHIVREYDRLSEAGLLEQRHKGLRVSLAVSDVRELATYALTEKNFQDLFRQITYEGQSAWTSFVTALRRLLGIPQEEESAFTRLLDVTDRVLDAPIPAEQRKFSRADRGRSQGIPAGAALVAPFRNDRPLKAHADYRAAKAGDPAAATRLVADVVPDAVLRDAVDRFGTDVVYSPVIAEEATGHNAIPRTLAAYFATRTGADLATGIHQSNRAFHTGAGAMERLIARPLFDGPVEAGRRYVLVDDVSVMGGTLAELAHHIRQNGGEIAGVALLVNASRMPHISPTASQIREIERRFGDVIQSDLRIDPGSLTAAEAAYLLNFRDADSLRGRIASARRQRDERLRAKGLRLSAQDRTGQAVISLTGEELGVQFNGPGDMPVLRRAAQAWYNQNLIGTTIKMQGGAPVRFNKRGLRKSTHGAKGDILLRSVPAIRAIIENGVVVHREPGRGDNVAERLVIAAPVEVMGQRHHLAVSVHMTRDGQFHYDLTFDRDAGSPGVGVPGGLAKQSRRSAEEGAPGIALERTPGIEPGHKGWKPSALPAELYPLANDLNLFLWPAESNDSVAALRRELAGSPFGGFVSRLIDLGRLTLGNAAALGAPDGALGWTDPDGTITLVADRIAPGQATAVLLHEALHAGGEPLIGSKAWTGLIGRLGRIYRQFERGTGPAKAFFDAARARAEQSGTEGALAAEEFGAYAVEEYEQAPAALKRWVDDAVGVVKAWVLRRFGRQLGRVTPAELRAIAAAALRDMAGGTETAAAPRRKFSRGAKIERADVVDAVKGSATDLKPKLLALVPLNYFSELKRPNMVAVDEYLKIKRAMDAYRGARHDAMDRTAQDWRKFAGANRKAAAHLADLMHLATLSGIDPTATDAATRAKPGYAEIRAAFDRLPPKARQLFVTVRDAYTAQQEELDQLILDNVRKANEIAEEKAEQRYKADLERIRRDRSLKEPERREKIEALQARRKAERTKSGWARKARVTKLRQAFEASRVDGPYFPLTRFGRYFVTVRDVDGEVASFSRFERERDRRRWLRENREKLDRDFPGSTVETGVLDNANDLRSAMDPRVLAEIETILGSSGVDEAVLDAIWQRYLETMPDLSIRKRYIHRKGTAGFQTDALRAFASHMFHAGHQMARLKHGIDLTEAVNRASDQAKRSDDPTAAGTLVNELRKRHQWVMNPTGSAAAQAVTSAMFTWYLAATPAAAIINLSQTPLLGVPILGSRLGGAAKATAALTAAAVDTVRGRGSVADSPGLTDDERRLVSAAYQSGLIDRTQSHELAGVGETGVAYSPLRHKIMSVISWAFHRAEVWNREVTALAAYRMARAAGQNHEAAVDTAHDLTWKVHFDYSNSSRARILQGDAAKLLAVFQNYQINTWFRIARDVHQAVAGESAQARKEARYQLAGMAGMMSLLGGVTGFFGYNVLMAIAGLVFDDDDDPFSFKHRMEQAVIDQFGPNLGGMILNGVPGHLAGIDLTSRIGMPDFFIRAPREGLEGRDWAQELIIGVLGVVPSTVINAVDGVDLMMSGETVRGAELIAPKAVKDVMKAYRYANEGVTSRRHDEILPVSKIDAWSVIAQAMGFTPARVSETYERNRRLKDAERRVMDERRELVNRFALAVRLGETDARNKAVEAIKRYNRRPYARGAEITKETLQRSLKTRARVAAQRQDGVLIQDETLGRYLRKQMPEAVYR